MEEEGTVTAGGRTIREERRKKNKTVDICQKYNKGEYGEGTEIAGGMTIIEERKRRKEKTLGYVRNKEEDEKRTEMAGIMTIQEERRQRKKRKTQHIQEMRKRMRKDRGNIIRRKNYMRKE